MSKRKRTQPKKARSVSKIRSKATRKQIAGDQTKRTSTKQAPVLDTFSLAAACLNVIPPSIASHSAKRPAGPSFALP